MTEHPTKQELDEYRSRVLAPAAFLSVHRHVSGCPNCAAECNSPKDLARDLDDLHAALLDTSGETPYHLSAAEVMAYARGTLNEIDLEIAESHVGVCQTCRSEVQRQAAEKRTPRRPVSSLMNWWQPWRVAAVVSCSVILILLAIWLLRTKPSEHKEQASGSTNLSSPQSSPAGIQQSSTPEVFSNTELVVVLNDGKQRVTVDRHGSLAGLERLPSPIQEKIRRVLQTGRLDQPPALAQLATQPSTLLSESDNGLPFGLIDPVGKVVRSKQPEFRWHALAGAQSYTVIVTDADLNEVASSPSLNTTEWRISKPLKEGGIYSWQVTALKAGVKITSPVLPAPQAKFKVIDRSTAELLKQAQRAYPDSHLTLGVLYAEAGLLDEAELELKVLVRNNPASRIAPKLLENIKAMRH